MELRIKADHTRAVTARQLARRMADLIDEMETEGFAFVVLRYGRPAALMVPIEPNVRRAPRSVSFEEVDPSDDVDEGIDISELGADERQLLLLMQEALPERFSPDSWPGPIWAFIAAFSRLELNELVTDRFGHRLTEKGERAAGLLKGAAGAA